MINVFSQMACICHLPCFMSWPEPPMGISNVGSFPVQSGGLIIFQLFRYRNLASNTFFFTFFRGKHVLYLGGLDAHYICTSHMFIHPSYVHMPLGV